MNPTQSQGSINGEGKEWCEIKTQLAIAGTEDGREPGAKKYGQLLEAGKQEKTPRFSPRASRKEWSPTNNFSPLKPIPNFWLPEFQDNKFELF